MDSLPDFTPNGPCRIVILDNIRSSHNVGAIFRTADGAGVSHICLVGHTPCPIDRFGRPVPEISKTALGAEQVVPWTYHTEATALIGDLAMQNFSLVAVEQTAAAVSLYDYRPPARVAYVFGNEVTGVSDPFLHAAETTVVIPMYGKKESLNVGVSVGVVLFQLMSYTFR